ncbi:hypothetical protein ACFVMC_21370 [Nocardia sp. NPDC127579]|uniref:hypothetical protein n=1 Tax=Nocardia sp. NPDC127579 TaxID=3345402 RepID=UPI00363AE162
MRVAVFVSALALLAGCAETESKSDAVDRTYREMVPDASAQLEYLDSIRPLDPCGFVDGAAVARLGRTEFFGAGSGLNSCEIAYATGNPVPLVVVEMVNQAWSSLAKPVDVGGGKTVNVDEYSETADHCNAYAPFDDKLAINYRVYGEGNRCDDVTAVAAASLPTLTTRPLRTESRHPSAATKLSRMDPCQPLGVVGKGQQRVSIGQGWDPSKCTFFVGEVPTSTIDNATSKFRHHIEFGFLSEMYSTQAGAGQPRNDIGSTPVTEMPKAVGADGCRLWIGVGHATPTLAAGEKRFDTIEVSVGSGGCAAARVIAEDLVRVYEAVD